MDLSVGTISANDHIGFDDIAAVEMQFDMITLFAYRLERQPAENLHAELHCASMKDMYQIGPINKNPPRGRI